MTVHIITIPDDQTQWPGWLEQQLVGSHLRELIEELRIVTSGNGSDPVVGEVSQPPSRAVAAPLGEILTQEQLTEIAQSGLAAVSASTIRKLLAIPDALLDLQEYVLINGSSHWQNLPVDRQLQTSVERGRMKLNAVIDDHQLPGRPAPISSGTKKTNRRSLAWIASAAALLLVGVLLWRMQPHPSGRILGTPGLLANNTSSSAEYFQRIAAAGQTWFDEQPADEATMIVLLEQTCKDCQILIDARHEALTAEERDWLVTKCRKWQGDLEQTLTSLKSGKINLETAQADADLIMQKLVNVLKSGPVV
jgi:hypothetical protein